MDIDILQLFKYCKIDTVCGRYKYYFYTSDEYLTEANTFSY